MKEILLYNWICFYACTQEYFRIGGELEKIRGFWKKRRVLKKGKLSTLDSWMVEGVNNGYINVIYIIISKL